MKNSSADIIVSPARLQEAFDGVSPELARMRKKGLLPVNVDPQGKRVKDGTKSIAWLKRLRSTASDDLLRPLSDSRPQKRDTWKTN